MFGWLKRLFGVKPKIEWVETHSPYADKWHGFAGNKHVFTLLLGQSGGHDPESDEGWSWMIFEVTKGTGVHPLFEDEDSAKRKAEEIWKG